MRSTREIAKSIAYYLEMSDPVNYPPGDRAKTMRAVNDILQGSPSPAADKLLAELEEKGGSYYAGEIKGVEKDILAFQEQKRRIGHPYTKTGGRQYKYRMNDANPDRPLKIVNQRLFDWAAKGSFPPDFFENAYFDHVTAYCMPDYTHCAGSVFRDCTFAVCRMVGTHFEDARLYGCEFHSCCLSGAIFSDSALANTHFYDCVQHRGGFIRTRLNRCRMMDCLVTGATFAESTLDGCSFDRVRANRIRGNGKRVPPQQGGHLQGSAAGGVPPMPGPAHTRAGAVKGACRCKSRDSKASGRYGRRWPSLSFTLPPWRRMPMRPA